MDKTYGEMQNTILQQSKALAATREHLSRLKDENNSLAQMHEEYKQHYEKLRKECNEMSKKFMESVSEKKEIETQFEAQMNHLKNMLEQRQRILDEQQAKSLTPMDTDLFRTKITREIQAPFRVKIEEQKGENDKLRIEINNLKRVRDITEAELSNTKQEMERAMSESKERYKTEVDEMVTEIQTLHNRIDDNRDREIIRTLRREVDEYKRKFVEVSKEITDLRRQRDEAKLEKNGLIINHSKEVDSEQKSKQILHSELETTSFKLKELEEDYQKEIMRAQERNQQITELVGENDHLKKIVRDQEIKESGLTNEKQNLEDRLTQRENELEVYFTKINVEDKEKYVQERKDRDKLQKEYEVLERKCQTALLTRDREGTSGLHEYEALHREHRLLAQDKNTLMNNYAQLQETYEGLRKIYEGKLDEGYQMEKELKKLQDKYRALIGKEQALVTSKEHLEFSLRVLEEENEKAKEERELWNNERGELQFQLGELTKQIEKSKGEGGRQVTRYKTKYTEYKNKVKYLNSKIKQFGFKLAQMELEKQHLSLNEGDKEKAPSHNLLELIKELPSNEYAIELLQNEEALKQQVDQVFKEHRDFAEGLGISVE